MQYCIVEVTMNNRDIQMFQQQMTEMLKSTQEKAMQIRSVSKNSNQSNPTSARPMQSGTTTGNRMPGASNQSWKLWDNTTTSRVSNQNQGSSMSGRQNQQSTKSGGVTQNNLQQEKPMSVDKFDTKQAYNSTAQNSKSNITSQRLQEAIIWSEILGKPVSKRHKRRFER